MGFNCVGCNLCLVVGCAAGCFVCHEPRLGYQPTKHRLILHNSCSGSENNYFKICKKISAISIFATVLINPWRWATCV